MRTLDLTNKRFGKLIAIKRGPSLKFGSAPHTTWTCACDCGKLVTVETQKLRSGHTKSCGCFRIEFTRMKSTTHGHSAGKIKTGRSSPEYAAWSNAKERCYNRNNKRYKHYGARGIVMCDQWRNRFESFYEHMGPRPRGASLDRIDNDGNYEPGNCRWATNKEQSSNKRNSIKVKLASGNEVSLREFSIIHGVPYLRVYKRVRSGMSPYEAVR